MTPNGKLLLACFFARTALAASFLSAVADRLGLWGVPGSPGVAWGHVQNYEGYVATLNWFLPQPAVPVLGWTASIAEVVIAIGLLVGWKLKWFATAGGLLLLLFAVAMTAAIGPKSPLDYSVFSAAAAAWLLAAIAPALQRPTV